MPSKGFGAIVGIGPRELSVNCIGNGVKTVYGRGFDKNGAVR